MRNLTQKTWGRFRCCWARRRSRDNLPAPILPNPPGFSLLPSILPSLPLLSDGKKEDLDLEAPYPAAEFYRDQQQVITEIERRTEAIGILPKPEVEKVWEKKKSVAS
jgi:hypothetical protein